jgi:hypothetical protein
MTISTTIIKNSYSGNGSTTAFTYNFKIAINTEIEVIVKTNATGAESIRSLGSGSANYGVSGVGNNSGTVTFVTAPTNLETVVLRRSTAQTQAMDLIDNDPMSAGTIETAHDKAIAISQELQEQLNRSIKISKTNTMTSTEFTVSAADRANKLLAFDASGELSITQEIGTFKGTSATTTTAAYVVRDIVKGSTTAQLNNIYICIQASPVGTALTNASYWTLIVDAFTSATSAATATTKANEAAASASTASGHKDTATTKASEATTAKNAAVTAQTAAEAALDSFDDRYLGAKSSAPSTDNDGNSLLTGALYFNSSDNIIYNWTGSAWQSLRPTSSEQTAINALAASAVVADMALLATSAVIEDMSLLANSDVIADMAILATNDVVADLNKLATTDIVNDLNTLATTDIVNDLNQLATSDFVSDLTAVEGIKAKVTTVADNLTNVNNFADQYTISANAPSNPDEGDLWYDSTNNVLKIYNGSNFVAVTSATAGISNLADDNSPQLGGNLDVVTHSLVSTSNRNIAITPNGSGKVVIDGLSHPVADGSNGQALVTNGSGVLGFATPSSAEVYGFEKYYNPSTLVKTVTVVSVGGANKYFIDGVQQDTLDLEEGNTYIFNYPSAHPFKFSTTSNGSHGGGSEYTTGVTHNSNSQVTIVVASGAPTLYYYCSSHSAMGGTANTPTPALNDMRYITTNKGADNITENQYANFDDVLFSASGFVFSISNGNLISTI